MRSILFALLIIALCYSCNSSKKDMSENHKYTNELIHETSPYLLQHAHNPVNWKAWNEETLNLAKAEKKLIILSVGYAACHWCHVMEKESFEDSTVAAVMNDNFINIKVDREERPDVDQIYISAVELMTGRAGWPLNVITLPDGRPVWGGTYFRKEDWIKSIEKIQELYEDEPQKLIEYADRLEEGIKSMDLVTFNTGDVDFVNYDSSMLIENWSRNFDNRFGGYNRAPKFMMPNNYHYLLRNAVANQDKDLLEYVTLTLDKMAYGGVYDHIGGGFARYSTDDRWHVPHFEKMLYDNAQLVSLYSDAYAITKNPLYQEIVRETLTFIKEELTHESGAFYSSLDADSETETGELEEGAYYIYSKTELEALLGSDFELFKSYYNINSFGKWENDHFVLIRTKSDQEITEEFSISYEVLESKKKNWKSMLLEYRNQRPRPRLDDKSLTSWNGLMLKGYVDAYKVFQNEGYLEVALKNARFIIENQLQPSGALYHNYKDGRSTINGYLEDYAAVIESFIALYEVTLDEKWLGYSVDLADYCFEKFYNSDKGMFYFTSEDDPKLVTRNIDYRDNVIPASNSIMAKNLFKLSHFYEKPKYAETAKQMLKNVQPEMEQYPGGFSNWLDLMANYQNDYYEVVVMGEAALEKVNEINANYIPNKLIAGSTSSSNSYLLKGRFSDGETLIYVCVNNTCKLPVRDTKRALSTIKAN
ncbi:MAG: thioredoxin domain-containing protein [Bacteroidia bacterium]|nr:thioredoxin domain-containing protein [Bacteroidia bacterium]NNF30575.1 thioredoxin domain-containing protein [Flavobacteriaceae bacterium]MBT8277091.1 thioredoxin domain-containing protein [Bacteroidia bacterium]NNJ81278.1 thioredoxin domain-containing protein [Flavobacteriaceae bacterium]NNK53104.1 thioredoxin domain-containing protein [Flavobacteriaceae bacterium]